MISKKIQIKIDPDIADLIPQFIENRHNDIHSLEELITAGNFEAISQLAHKIKGSAGGYGFDGLSTIAAKMETAAKQSNLTDVKNLFAQAQEYLNSVEIIYPS